LENFFLIGPTQRKEKKNRRRDERECARKKTKSNEKINAEIRK
jgi:hypothetical protein